MSKVFYAVTYWVNGKCPFTNICPSFKKAIEIAELMRDTSTSIEIERITEYDIFNR